MRRSTNRTGAADHTGRSRSRTSSASASAAAVVAVIECENWDGSPAPAATPSARQAASAAPLVRPPARSSARPDRETRPGPRPAGRRRRRSCPGRGAWPPVGRPQPRPDAATPRAHRPRPRPRRDGRPAAPARRRRTPLERLGVQGCGRLLGPLGQRQHDDGLAHQPAVVHRRQVRAQRQVAVLPFRLERDQIDAGREPRLAGHHRRHLLAVTGQALGGVTGSLQLPLQLMPRASPPGCTARRISSATSAAAASAAQARAAPAARQRSGRRRCRRR